MQKIIIALLTFLPCSIPMPELPVKVTYKYMQHFMCESVSEIDPNEYMPQQPCYYAEQLPIVDIKLENHPKPFEMLVDSSTPYKWIAKRDVAIYTTVMKFAN